MTSIEDLQKRLDALTAEAEQFAATANRQIEANRRYEAAAKDQMAFYNGQLAMLRELMARLEEEAYVNGRPESEARTINGDTADSETADAGTSD